MFIKYCAQLSVLRIPWALDFHVTMRKKKTNNIYLLCVSATVMYILK